MKKALYVTLIMAVLFSCTKEKTEPINSGDSIADTPENILLAVEKMYRVDCIVEGNDAYVITFDNPSPITIQREYPEGIKEVKLMKTEVSSLEDGGRFVSIIFADEKSVRLEYGSYISVTFDTDRLSFDEEGTPESLSFEVNVCSTDSVSIEVLGCEDFLTVETDYSVETKKGNLKFFPCSGRYFDLKACVCVGNGQKSCRAEISLVRADFKFADGMVEKSFSFPEYERMFEIEMHRADMGVGVSVPEESASWLKSKIVNVNVDGEDRTIICVLVCENTGDRERTARIAVSKDGCDRELSIYVRQIGYAMEGSFKRGLTEFYNSLNGNAWNCSENWCTERPLFEWYGIRAAAVSSKTQFGDDGFAYFGTDDVWMLDLAANNMRGTIPDDFWKICKYFESIRISSEYLPTSSVPDCIWHKGLFSLDLSMSFMNVPLSVAVGNAENLTRLNIQACNVNGSLPAAITHLASLEQVNMRECGITGELPSTIGDMKALREFYLDHNMEFGGTLPDSFYNLENLTDFDVSATRIGGHLKPAISRLKKLEGFWITGCEFEGTIPEEFGLIDNLIGYDFDGNYFTSLPEFVRYYGYNSKYAKEWVGSAGFPIGVPYYQRKKSDGRPENYVVVVPDCSEMSEILVNGQPLKRPGYYVDFSKCRQLPFPVWARVRYGIWCWTIGRIDEMKYPKYPSADDLQYPGNEYYFDGKDWRHAKLEYPAREYYYDGQKWVHDPSCPWDKEYVDPIGE